MHENTGSIYAKFSPFARLLITVIDYSSHHVTGQILTGVRLAKTT